MIPSDLNHSFMILLPKVNGATDIKDFRPICLINGMCKLISKVLVSRLNSCMSPLISNSQFAFLKGRSIHECSFVASEIVHLIHTRKESFLMLKTDFNKAFDSIS